MYLKQWCPTFLLIGTKFETKQNAGKKKAVKHHVEQKSVCFTAIFSHKILVIQCLGFQIDTPQALGKVLVGKKMPAGTADLTDLHRKY
jgi:hypothetical protein